MYIHTPLSTHNQHQVYLPPSSYTHIAPRLARAASFSLSCMLTLTPAPEYILTHKYHSIINALLMHFSFSYILIKIVTLHGVLHRFHILKHIPCPLLHHGSPPIIAPHKGVQVTHNHKINLSSTGDYSFLTHSARQV